MIRTSYVIAISALIAGVIVGADEYVKGSFARTTPIVAAETESPLSVYDRELIYNMAGCGAEDYKCFAYALSRWKHYYDRERDRKRDRHVKLGWAAIALNATQRELDDWRKGATPGTEYAHTVVRAQNLISDLQRMLGLLEKGP